MEMIMLLIAIVVAALVTSLLLWYSNQGLDDSHSISMVVGQYDNQANCSFYRTGTC